MKVELVNSSSNIEEIIATSAGICYDNETNDPERLVRRLRLSKHLATFRFAHVTFQVSEFSRSCSMQMLRHAFLDYLQRSQRYVKEFQFEYVIPPAIEAIPEAKRIFIAGMEDDQMRYNLLMKLDGIRAEDARYILPNACYTKMNIVGNIQSWYDFLYGDAGRLQKAAQWEIREIAEEIERQLKELAPNIFINPDE